jgi:hypothetical protein
MFLISFTIPYSVWNVEHMELSCTGAAEKRAIIKQKIVQTLFLQNYKKYYLKIYNKAYYFLKTTSSRRFPPSRKHSSNFERF